MDSTTMLEEKDIIGLVTMTPEDNTAHETGEGGTEDVSVEKVTENFTNIFMDSGENAHSVTTKAPLVSPFLMGVVGGGIMLAVLICSLLALLIRLNLRRKLERKRKQIRTRPGSGRSDHGGFRDPPPYLRAGIQLAGRLSGRRFTQRPVDYPPQYRETDLKSQRPQYPVVTPSIRTPTTPTPWKPAIRTPTTPNLWTPNTPTSRGPTTPLPPSRSPIPPLDIIPPQQEFYRWQVNSVEVPGSVHYCNQGSQTAGLYRLRNPRPMSAALTREEQNQLQFSIPKAKLASPPVVPQPEYNLGYVPNLQARFERDYMTIEEVQAQSRDRVSSFGNQQRRCSVYI